MIVIDQMQYDSGGWWNNTERSRPKKTCWNCVKKHMKNLDVSSMMHSLGEGKSSLDQSITYTQLLDEHVSASYEKPLSTLSCSPRQCEPHSLYAKWIYF